MKITDKIELYNCDNMLLMARYPDNYFDLAIVDPPYGEQVIQGGYMSNSSSKIAKNKNYNKLTLIAFETSIIVAIVCHGFSDSNHSTLL